MAYEHININDKGQRWRKRGLKNKERNMRSIERLPRMKVLLRGRASDRIPSWVRFLPVGYNHFPLFG